MSEVYTLLNSKLFTAFIKKKSHVPKDFTPTLGQVNIEEFDQDSKVVEEEQKEGLDTKPDMDTKRKADASGRTITQSTTKSAEPKEKVSDGKADKDDEAVLSEEESGIDSDVSEEGEGQFPAK
jgi:hypothetical protein